MLRFIILVIVALLVMIIARRILVRLGIITQNADRINKAGEQQRDGMRKDNDKIEDAKFEEIK